MRKLRYLKQNNILTLAALVAVLGLVFPMSATAAADIELLSQDNANILWTLIAGILVMFMQAGFACVEAGFTRAKSAGNIIMKNFLDFGAGQITFFFFGFALMFGTDLGGFIGTDQFMLSGTNPNHAGEGFDGFYFTFWFFQSVFAATAATIVSGGVAERTKFSTYILMSIIVTGFIYPISGHWAWGSLNGDASAGWLEGLGFMDFAGSTVVHSVGGWVALAGAMVVGPRLGKYGPDGKPNAIPGHNIPLGGLGVLILWFGWFGFNPGSTTTADNTIGIIAMNTSLAAAAGVLGAMATAWSKYGKPDMSMTMNGALAGLVAITAPCYTVSPFYAVIIGLIGGIICVFSIDFIDKVLKVDDPVGAVSVHGTCGAWGTIATGLFSYDVGLFLGGGIGQTITQIIGVAAVFVWAFGAGWIAFSILKAVVGVRASDEDQMKGLDVSEHDMEAYNGSQIFTTE
jgi:Amt family ammonium transporter